MAAEAMRRRLGPARRGARWAFAAAALLALGCSRCPVPVVAGEATAEPELHAFLAGLVAAAQARPCSPAVLGQLAMAYDVNGFRVAAATTYAQAAELGDDPRWDYHLAVTQAAGGEYEAALASMARALSADGGYAPGWLRRGFWLLALDRPEPAAEAFAQALTVAEHPAQSAAAVAGAARADLRRGDIAGALARLEPAVMRWRSPHLEFLLRRARQRSAGDDGRAGGAPPPTQALRWPDPRRDALAAYVRGLSGSLALAERLLRAGRAEQAVDLLEPLRAGHPHNRQLANDLGNALRLSGRQDDALEVLGAGLGRHPDYAPLHFNLAVLQEARGDAAAAERHYREALRLNPDMAGPPRRLARLLARTDRPQAARAIAEDAAAAHPGRAELRFVAGMVAGVQGDWPAAFAHLEAAVRGAPANARAWLLLATAGAEVGDFEAAERARQTAERLGVDAAEIESARRHAEDRRQAATTPTPAAAAGQPATADAPRVVAAPKRR